MCRASTHSSCTAQRLCTASECQGHTPGVCSVPGPIGSCVACRVHVGCRNAVCVKVASVHNPHHAEQVLAQAVRLTLQHRIATLPTRDVTLAARIARATCGEQRGHLLDAA
jgi:hypothetical protein